MWKQACEMQTVLLVRVSHSTQKQAKTTLHTGPAEYARTGKLWARMSSQILLSEVGNLLGISYIQYIAKRQLKKGQNYKSET